MEIICKRACGFRVHDRYYFEKKDRFAPGVCARCNGPLLYVEHNTDTPVEGVTMVQDGREQGLLKAGGGR